MWRRAQAKLGKESAGVRMSAHNTTNLEQPFADALAALDEQLERGESPDSIPELEASADQQALFNLAKDSLLRLERTLVPVRPSLSPSVPALTSQRSTCCLEPDVLASSRFIAN